MWIVLNYYIVSFLVPPGVPFDLKVGSIGESVVNLEWRQPKDDGGSKILKYIIKKRKDKKSEWERVMSVDGSERSYQVSGLTQGTEYFFAVSAENKSGPGKLSELPEPVVPKREPSKQIYFNYLLLKQLKKTYPSNIQEFEQQKKFLSYRMTKMLFSDILYITYLIFCSTVFIIFPTTS